MRSNFWLEVKVFLWCLSLGVIYFTRIGCKSWTARTKLFLDFFFLSYCMLWQNFAPGTYSQLTKIYTHPVHGENIFLIQSTTPSNKEKKKTFQCQKFLLKNISKSTNENKTCMSRISKHFTITMGCHSAIALQIWYFSNFPLMWKKMLFKDSTWNLKNIQQSLVYNHNQNVVDLWFWE